MILAKKQKRAESCTQNTARAFIFTPRIPGFVNCRAECRERIDFSSTWFQRKSRMENNQIEKTSTTEAPPFGSWNAWYAVVLLTLTVLIILFYLLTETYK